MGRRCGWISVTRKRGTSSRGSTGCSTAAGLLVQRLNRVQNQSELIRFDTATGEGSRVLRESDPYWINLSDDLRLFPDRNRFLWSTEKSGGFRHLCVMSFDCASVPLTAGQWEVRSVAGMDHAAGTVYYTSSEVSPIETHLFSIRLDGSGKTRLTSEAGMHASPCHPMRGTSSTSLRRSTGPGNKPCAEAAMVRRSPSLRKPI